MPSSQKDFRVLERRVAVAQQYLQGEQQYVIARNLKVSQSQISLDLKALRQAWLASALRDFDALKAEQLAKLDVIEREAFLAWAQSRQPREMSFTETTEGGEMVIDGQLMPRSPRRKESLRKEGQAGDPRFLQVIQKCIEQRCAILGLGEEQAALKAASQGLASLLEQARQEPLPPALPPPTMAEA
jgi:hypothetical protein